MPRLTTRLLLELEKMYATYGSHCETGMGVIRRDSLAALERGPRNECRNLVFLEQSDSPSVTLEVGHLLSKGMPMIQINLRSESLVNASTTRLRESGTPSQRLNGFQVSDIKLNRKI